MTRDLSKRPYTADERRVGLYLDRITNGDVGWGDDPIGFLLASHETMAADRAQRIKEGKMP